MRRLLALVATLVAALTQVVPAAACGGLVAPNGAVRLARAATLVAWHDGVEHYMTSFTYEGDVANLGWIVPLPAVPDRIEEGGAWTLQRLLRESRPVPEAAFLAAGVSGAQLERKSVEIIQQTKVEALDITVLRGSGQAVVDWCAHNGYLLPDETRGHLLAYAASSPIFMAARYDLIRARLRNQFSGDGAPVLITMHTPHLWVPLEVLANANDPVGADLYLLTDKRPAVAAIDGTTSTAAVGTTLPGAPGLVVRFQEPMNGVLHRDLSTDRNMSWVRPDGWFTYLSLDAPGRTVTYDMSLTSAGVMRLASMGIGPGAPSTPPELRFLAPLPQHDTPPWVFATVLPLLLAAAVGAAVLRRRSAGALL